jgi:hypothetical protein
LLNQVQLYIGCGSLGVQSSPVQDEIKDGTQSKWRKGMIAGEVRQAKETEE